MLIDLNFLKLKFIKPKIRYDSDFLDKTDIENGIFQASNFLSLI